MRAGRCGAMADGAVLRTLSTILTILTVFACAHARQPSFQGLGDFPGGAFESKAWAVSGDGAVVVGYGASARGQEAFRWTEAEGMVPLAPPGSTLPNGWTSTEAVAVSADGSVIVGNWDKPDENSGSGYRTQPFRWTAAQGMVALPGMPADSMWVYAKDISADGSVLVGLAYPGIAYRWTAETGAVDIGDLDGYPDTCPKAVSDSGEVVAGYSIGSGSIFEGWRWTAEGGFQGIGNLRGEGFDSIVTGISADGTTLVGVSDVAAPDGSADSEAFRWTPDQGMAGLGDLPGGRYDSAARACSADGSIVVGNTSTGRGLEAFIWDECHGMRRLCDVLFEDFGIDTTAWALTYATDISDDGTVIAGYGDNPDGNVEAWVAVVPEPEALLFLAAGAVCLLRLKG